MPSLARLLYIAGVVLLILALLVGLAVIHLAVSWVVLLILGLVFVGIGYAVYGDGAHGYRRW